MKDRELLPGSISEDVAIVLILGEDFSKASPENPSPTAGAISMNDLENGDTITMATPHLQEQTALRLFKRRKSLLDRDFAEGHPEK